MDIRRGITGTGLKIIALVTMLLDHIHYFFGFTGWIPEWFSMLGRLSAPLFLFCVVEGFSHTSNRRRYYLRIWAIAAGMGLVQFLMFCGVGVRPDGFIPMNAAMKNFAILMIIWQGMDWLQQRKFGRGIAAVLLPLLVPYGIVFAIMRFPALSMPLSLLCYTVLPAWPMATEFSVCELIVGVALYALRNRRAWQASAFAAIHFAWYFGYMALRLWRGVPGFAFAQMFTTYYEWMGIFAALLMLLYNGQRGAGLKRLFYIFYPAHVYILYALSWAVLAWLGW